MRVRVGVGVGVGGFRIRVRVRVRAADEARPECHREHGRRERARVVLAKLGRHVGDRLGRRIGGGGGGSNEEMCPGDLPGRR